MIPSFLASLLMQSSDSPILLMAPQMAWVLAVGSIRPVFSSTSAMIIWTEALSLAAMMRLLAEHFLGTYKSTYSPASFCILMDAAEMCSENAQKEYLYQTVAAKTFKG